ncbi:MAG: sodium:proton exchanger [Bacteroidetes bacterium]|nr:sodium:proton exchanger [Bacteroidota bacterium]
MSAYDLIIAGSLALILSYFFSELSRKTNIPSVLLLILTGIMVGRYKQIDSSNLQQVLEVLGVVGLIMIVLEGALDLELTKEKLPLIKKSSGMALVVLIASVLIIGLSISFAFRMDVWISFLYATPLSVISSAIVIPSVENLKGDKKEFLVYESCISDILGIMLFYLLIGLLENDNKTQELFAFSWKLILTIVVSVFTSFGLIILFKYIRSKVKIFLFLAILIVLYAIEKQLHLSPLILILLFGLMLKNNQLVFKNRWARLVSRMELKLMERNFHIITRETSFVLRTFFFIVFGLSMILESLLDIRALLLSISVVLILFALRWIGLRLFQKDYMQPALYIAPRGLITVLLYYSIPSQFKDASFPESVILYVVLITSLVMTFGLISYRKDPTPKKLRFAGLFSGVTETGTETETVTVTVTETENDTEDSQEKKEN